jgi:prepilin-type N-terminal cleavage/methylation domain-containing protein
MSLWARHSGNEDGRRDLRRVPIPLALPPAHQGSRSTRSPSAFTLIELILVMALLTIVISLTAPSLSRFFHGRTLDSEARRLLALTRSGQSRAVSEGLPMDLWVDPAKGEFGLAAEPSYETTDPRAVEFELDSRLRIEVVNKAIATSANTMNRSLLASVASAPRVVLAHADLPTIRFLPDGSIGEGSPQKLHLASADGGSLWLAQSRDGLSYEIRSTDNEDSANTQLTGR